MINNYEKISNKIYIDIVDLLQNYLVQYLERNSIGNVFRIKVLDALSNEMMILYINMKVINIGHKPFYIADIINESSLAKQCSFVLNGEDDKDYLEYLKEEFFKGLAI